MALACGVRYGVRSTLIPLVAPTRAKCCPNLQSLSRIRYVGVRPYGVASRSCCATQGSVGVGVTFTWITFRDFSSTMKKAKSGRKKRSVTCKRITGPHLCRVIAQKRFPVLSTSMFWANLLHILLNRPFTHSNIQLEQFATDTLSPPQSVACCHFLDQRNGLKREPRLLRMRLGFALPEHAEKLTMPAYKRLWLYQ